jgi:hypothetical protein
MSAFESLGRGPNSYDSYADATGRLQHEVLGHCEVKRRDGCRMLVEQCYPELLS